MMKTAVNTRDSLILVAASALLLAASSLPASEMDKQIESSAKKSYVFKHFLADDAIKTESKNGVVTLTGTVADDSHIGLAGETVQCLPGVKSVDNRLVVKGEAPAQHSDAWVAQKVKTALMFHRNLGATETEVSVNDGIVTLGGAAGTIAQKELAAEDAEDVEGVKEVKNAITVVQITAKPDASVGEKIDDASITAQVKMSLLSHRSTSHLKTRVETTDGVVTLTGVARTAAERELVTKLATEVNGVGSVINNMTIEMALAKRNSVLLPPQNLRIVSQ